MSHACFILPSAPFPVGSHRGKGGYPEKELVSPLGRLLVLSLSFCLALWAHSAAETNAYSVRPTFANVSYGPNKLNTLDFWKAQTGQPAPVLIFIHGGGFRSGAKEDAAQWYDIAEVLKQGISFASFNYRLTGTDPYPAQMMDCARAVQFLRANAQTYGFDPARMATTGGSAGAGISQWLAFRDDLADPQSQDPVARQSTRLSCALPFNAQTTYDPREIKQIIPGDAYNIVQLKALFGVPQTFNWDTDPISPELDSMLRDASPVHHLSEDDPPVMIVQFDQMSGIHSPEFGRYLKTKMDSLGLECDFSLRSKYSNDAALLAARISFLKEHFDNAVTAVKYGAADNACIFYPITSLSEETASQFPDASATEVYKTFSGGLQLRMFIWNPPNFNPGDKRPAIVFFHGGGFVGGSAAQFHQHCRYFASRGMVAATAEYRLDINERACVMDAKHAIRFMRKNAARLGVNPNRIVSSGGSAGGFMTMDLGTVQNLDDYDDAPENTDVSYTPNALVGFNPAIMGPETGRSSIKDILPYNHIHEGMPPSIMMYGVQDNFLVGATDFQRAAEAKGNRCEVLSWEHAGHGFFNLGGSGNRFFAETVDSADRFLVSLDYLNGPSFVQEFLTSSGQASCRPNPVQHAPQARDLVPRPLEMHYRDGVLYLSNIRGFGESLAILDLRGRAVFSFRVGPEVSGGAGLALTAGRLPRGAYIVVAGSGEDRMRRTLSVVQ